MDGNFGKESYMGNEKHKPEHIDDAPGKTFVAKIFTQALEFDYKYPWRAPSLSKWSGSGFILGGNRLVTNAHVAAGAVNMEVQLAGDSKRYIANIKHIANECDLAQLEVDDPEFWEKTEAKEVSTNPAREEEVRVVGFPMGGDRVSVTKGIVSRMENNHYAQSGRMLMDIQIDAAINPGNSGGPVINNDGEIVGVAFQGYRGAQLLGYMIPASVLDHFLNQVEAEEKGFPELGIETQNMESPYLREHHKIPEDKSGIIVKKIAQLSPCKGVLKEGDVITEIDGIPVNGDGTVYINPMKKMEYDYLINNKHIGEEATFKVWRSGRERELTVTLNNALGATETIIPMEHGKRPTYYILAGQIVVQPVTENFMQAMRQGYKNREKETPDEQLVAINCLLKSGYTNGYRNLDGQLITEVNGNKINNIEDLVHAVECHDGATHVIKTNQGEEVVIPNISVEKQQEILDRFYIDKDRSPDLPQRGGDCKLEEDVPEPDVQEEENEMPPLFFSELLGGLLGGINNNNSASESSEEELTEEAKKQRKPIDFLDLARQSAQANKQKSATDYLDLASTKGLRPH